MLTELANQENLDRKVIEEAIKRVCKSKDVVKTL
jgi:predicted regulator of amino acid metabolism with ACT domain